MYWLRVALVFVTSICFASQCPDPRLRQATIGGDAIDGSIVLQKKPMRFAQIQLYFSSGKTAWVGTTGKDGTFHITHLQPGTYRLVVRGWGSTKIRLDPKLTKLGNGQIPRWSVQLMDNECVAYSAVVN